MRHLESAVDTKFMRSNRSAASLALGCCMLLSLLLRQTASAQPARCTLDRSTGTTIDAEPFERPGWGTRWNLPTNRVSFLRPGNDGYYRATIVNADGTNLRSLSSIAPGLPTKHQGPLSWYPSGKYVLLAAQKQAWSGKRLFGSPDYEALPGFGRHNDLWLVSVDSGHVWRLTDEGFLISIFSPDGRHVAWAARQPGGTYELKIADFEELPEPHLTNIASYTPGGPAYYEPGSFTSDGQSLVYTSDQDTHSFWKSQIYKLDLATRKSTRMTFGESYNEHPIVWQTPSGDWFTFMSDRDVARLPFHFFPGTAWWAMRLDGTGLKRLTTLSARAMNNPEHSSQLALAGTTAPSPTFDWFLGDTQDNIATQTGEIRVVRLTCK
jgi:Tol biopolymer transport system component